MSTAQLDHIRPVTRPERVGQSTAVEQSRAVAEVHAAVVVAQQCPRSIQLAIEDMKDACSQIELAEVAFFRYNRGDGIIQGPSVHLARELARCWGNIQYGIRELARDDVHGQSEMQSWAWDVQKNSRDSSDFIVPHKRDTKKGVKELVDMRDIYENNANNGARRLREMIFAMLPVWYRAQAEKLCRETIENGGGVPIATRRADAVKAFERFRVSPARLAAKFGYKTVDELTAHDVAQLGVIWQSLSQGTVTVADEFPEGDVPRASAADIIGQPQNVPPVGSQPLTTPSAGEQDRPGPAPVNTPEPAGGTPRKPQMASTGQVGMIRKKFAELYPGEETEGDRIDRLSQTAKLAGIYPDPLETTSALTSQQAVTVRKRLDSVTTAKQLEERIDALMTDGEWPDAG